MHNTFTEESKPNAIMPEKGRPRRKCLTAPLWGPVLWLPRPVLRTEPGDKEWVNCCGSLKVPLIFIMFLVLKS